MRGHKSVVLPLVVITVVIFLIQIMFKGFTESFMLVSADVLTRPWILVTSIFLHGGFNHLFFNMYGLLLFGPLLESRIGPKRFLWLYFLGGVIVAIVSSFFYNAALGASGAIMAVIGALIIVMPQLRLLFLFMIPMPLWVAGIVWFLIDFFGIFIPSGVANIGHIVGMGFGLLFALYLKKKKGKKTERVILGSHLTKEDLEGYMRSGRI